MSLLEQWVTHITTWYKERLQVPTVHTITSLEKERQEKIHEIVDKQHTYDPDSLYRYLLEYTHPMIDFHKRFDKPIGTHTK